MYEIYIYVISQVGMQTLAFIKISTMINNVIDAAEAIATNKERLTT